MICGSRWTPAASWGVALFVVLAPAPAAAQDDGRVRSTLDSVYTAEQADRGRAIYTRVCSGCHALDWYQGDVLRSWEGAPVYDLFQVIRTTMPKDNPGSLDRRAYLDMMAYILALNGMPPGSGELPPGASDLRKILFRWSSKP